MAHLYHLFVEGAGPDARPTARDDAPTWMRRAQRLEREQRAGARPADTEDVSASDG
ncbi:hypothetical protein ACF061_18005 [Streptomyces sp. NPDC015220]|uniref:hypothetical protein n=1 Tax=Streptomyces sp. NPDC015220 TaxID=3364947 RepID=UPI0036F4DD4A